MLEIFKNKSKYPQKLFSSKFVRFFLVGGFAALIDILLLFLFTEYFKIHYIYGASLSFVLVTLGAFFVHKHFTFRGNTGSNPVQIPLFFLINILGLGLYLLFLKIGVDYLGFYYLYVAIVSKFLVFVWNFLANKFITFHA